MRLKTSALAAACALLCLAPASALASHSAKHKPKHKQPKPAPTYYLALGDSLARGAQPNATGTTVPTSNGYANFLYATEKKTHKQLKLQELGCLGETTTTMLKGGICKYAAGSQQAAAIKFIHSHKKKLSFITLDIGANDIDGCVSGENLDTTCLTTGIASLQANVPTIVSQLRKAAGAKTPIAAMTYYDPFLAAYLTGVPGQGLAQESVLLATEINGDLTTAFKAQHLRVADVAASFDTNTPFSTTGTIPGVGTVPLAVAQICNLTWECAPAPKGPNIHATTTGYKQIAKVFAAAL